MPWFLHLALRQLFPPGKRFPAFATVSILGVGLGVASLLVVQTVMNGFGEEHRLRIRESFGDCQVTAAAPIEQPETLAKQLAARPAQRDAPVHQHIGAVGEAEAHHDAPLFLALQTGNEARLAPPADQRPLAFSCASGTLRFNLSSCHSPCPARPGSSRFTASTSMRPSLRPRNSKSSTTNLASVRMQTA